MGWFSSSSDSPATIDAPKPSNDGGFIAPDRNQRAHCWEGRDAFFACLDRNNIIDSVKESDKAIQLCSSENQLFEKNCASSWVQYFKKRRVMEYQRDQTLKRLETEGAKNIDQTTGGSFGGKPTGR
ncbi:hypothetical protein BT93_L5223 [Corymbia citriodora subsp. variegata]|uniref:Uncharacterized protein n=1 Tax=Corymbia citriodora subsp. variegata TaxID=360336 RepID=A0A8T0CF76_CORYI|nr:hypothetical protein BT93_L5223 [Corymbia citriodora subsp. variegata]